MSKICVIDTYSARSLLEARCLKTQSSFDMTLSTYMRVIRYIGAQMP